ncbi:MAG TPA: GNAT family N-acetyltransferase [Streptosporangiaceae bacterium]|nr:GNAT family N-acetyltransferase [Streptosporangiaceae bacterium]
MISLRVASSDADLENWRRVRVAVAPGERTATVPEIRAMEEPGRLLLVAEEGGVLVGSGVADRSDLSGGFVCPRVLPEARRRGVGTAILRALAEHSASQSYRKVASVVEDEGSLAFARLAGFAEVDRQLQQIRQVGTESPPVAPAGIEIVSIADRPELWRQAYDRLAETFADMGFTNNLQVPLEQWEREWIGTPEASFVALADGDVVGVASLKLDAEDSAKAENGYTAVRREWRGRGVAKALKRTTLAWAADHDIAEIQTWTQRGNEAMRALNELLGYRYATVSIRVESALPLGR